MHALTDQSAVDLGWNQPPDWSVPGRAGRICLGGQLLHGTSPHRIYNYFPKEIKTSVTRPALENFEQFPVKLRLVTVLVSCILSGIITCIDVLSYSMHVSCLNRPIAYFVK